MNFQDLNKTTHFMADLNATGKEFIISIFDADREPKVVNLRSFRKDTITFGRNPENDIVLESKLVSRSHGYFKITPSSCTIYDTKSTNGLILNGSIIEAKDLAEGDRIRIDNPDDPSVKGVLILFGTVKGQFNWNTFEVVDKQTITIGRDASCDIQLDHASVSKIHARIEREGSHYYLVDNNSTNGVSVSGVRVTNKTLLKEKDLILITNSKLTFTRQRISYFCFTSGFGLDAVDLVRTVTTKGESKNICNHITLAIEPCEFVAIVGGSGAGKSTFMNCISGYVPATSGTTVVNGEDLYSNYSTIKSIIGYVPQQDIVYDNLTLVDMLSYAARLRMPHDSTENERTARINSVIKSVELTGHENTFIGRLSGGQKKRGSIAVELLSDPNLFFLDEPTSGLDPGTERNLMHTLHGMTRGGKTIILVTHNALNLHLCDKIIFLGNGGNLCYAGSYDDALTFFGVDNLVNVYNMLTDNAVEWKEKYDQSKYKSIPQFGSATKTNSSGKTHNSISRYMRQMFLQVGVLSKRYAHLMVNDKQRMILLLLQPVVLVLLISLVKDGEEFAQYEMTKSILFALACADFWIGIMNTIQEVCKERVILKREYMTGLKLPAYIGSKLGVMIVLSAIQALLLLVTFNVVIGSPEDGIIFGSFGDMYITTFNAILAASALGLFVSSIFKNSDRALTIAPILVLPQILYSGIMFSLEGIKETISYVVFCRWSMESYGSIADLNNLPLKAEQDGFALFVHEFEDIFERTHEHLNFTWLILLGYVVVFAIASGIVLRSVKND